MWIFEFEERNAESRSQSDVEGALQEQTEEITVEPPKEEVKAITIVSMLLSFDCKLIADDITAYSFCVQ